MPREKIKEGVLGGTGVEGRQSGHADDAKEEITGSEEVEMEEKNSKLPKKKQKKNIFERPKFE
jgi:hypothetical protein